MSPMPYYVSPEQMMKDRADFAQKGIARGRSLIAIECADGILVAGENPSLTLHKISEVYDRIAFAAVGKYNEFESFRIAGVRLADMRGYSYDREDVTAKAIANAYAQALGNIFTQEMKPYEIELLVAQVGQTPEMDELYRIRYDGSVSDEQGTVAIGGHAEAITQTLRDGYNTTLSFSDALRLAARALEGVEAGRTLPPEMLEIAVLDRTRTRRAFRRIAPAEAATMLGG